MMSQLPTPTNRKEAASNVAKSLLAGATDILMASGQQFIKEGSKSLKKTL